MRYRVFFGKESGQLFTDSFEEESYEEAKKRAVEMMKGVYPNAKAFVVAEVLGEWVE